MNVLQQQEKGAKLTVRDGHPICPVCRKKMSPKILPTTSGENVVTFCRNCKQELIVNIDKGQCFESRCQ